MVEEEEGQAGDTATALRPIPSGQPTPHPFLLPKTGGSFGEPGICPGMEETLMGMARVVARRSKSWISCDSGAGVLCGTGVEAQLGGGGAGQGPWSTDFIPREEARRLFCKEAPWYALRSGKKNPQAFFVIFHPFLLPHMSLKEQCP